MDSHFEPEALETVVQLMLIHSLRAEWWSWLGRRNAKNGDYQSALACFQRVLLSFPDSAYAHSNIGYCHSGLRHYEEAVKAYDRALQARPDYAYAHAELGRMLVFLRRPQQAIEELNRAFRIDPKLKSKADYQLVLASALARLGHTDQ